MKVKRVSVKGIKYFLKDVPDDRVVISFENSISVKKLMDELGIDIRFVGYIMQNGKPVMKDSSIEKEDEITLIPILSGG